MKRYAALLLLIVFAYSAYAQRKDITGFLNMEGVLKEDYQSFKKGDPVKLMNVIKLRSNKDQGPDGILMAVSINYEQVAIPTYDAKVLDLKPANMEQFWMWTFIKNKMFDYYDRKGYHYEPRRELTEEANTYLENLTDLFYEDAYIEDYIQTVFTGIIPENVDKKRPEKLSVQILKSPAPDAYMLPNGMLLISTGLLSTLDSVEELSAIITSEVAHFVLDHQMVNVAQEISRVRRSIFWGEVVPMIIQGIDMAVNSSSDEFHIAGAAVSAASGLASLVLDVKVLNRLGMVYTKKQVAEADQVAVEFLKFNNMNTTALASALTKIKNYYETEKDFYALSKYGNFGDIDRRLSKLEEPQEIKNRDFQRKMSSVNTFNAIVMQNSKNFKASERFAMKNVENNLATDDDYVILVKSSMGLTNSPEANERNLEFIRKAKDMSLVPNLNLYKQEILLLLRMDRQTNAAEMIREYVDLLKDYQKHVEAGSEAERASAEIGWANKLYQQVNLF